MKSYRSGQWSYDDYGHPKTWEDQLVLRMFYKDYCRRQDGILMKPFDYEAFSQKLMSDFTDPVQRDELFAALQR